jgi:hypothetical protein
MLTNLALLVSEVIGHNGGSLLSDRFLTTFQCFKSPGRYRFDSAFIIPK